MSLALALPAGTFAARDQGTILISVSATDPATGFVDPELKASAKDLTDELAKRKGLRVVDVSSKPDVRLQIKKRSKRAQAGYVAGSVVVPIEETVLDVTLSAGEYSTDISGAGSRMTSGASWRKAAGKVAESIERWIVENKALLLARRMAPSKPSPTPS